MHNQKMRDPIPRVIVTGVVLFSMAGCAVPSLGIRLAPVAPSPAGAVTQVIDQRPAAEHETHYASEMHSTNHFYIADKDTLPDRMTVLRGRLAADGRFAGNPQAQVVVSKFDILWDESGRDVGFDVNVGRHRTSLATEQIGNGVDGFTCTLAAAWRGRELRRVARVDFAIEETDAASSAPVGAAVQQCLDDVIGQWIDAAATSGGRRRR